MENDKVEKILVSINKIRTTPKDCVKELETISKGLFRFMKKKEGQELLDYSKTLISKSPLNDCVLSQSLCKAAQLKLDLLLQDIQESQEEMQKRIEANVSGFTEIKEMSDLGEIDSLIGRLLISDNDPQRLYRQAIFNKLYEYVGIAVGYKDGVDISVIVFADKVSEPNSKPLDELILENINRYRKQPYKSVSKLRELIKSAPKSVQDNFEEFTMKISTSEVKSVTRAVHLDKLAENLFSKIEAREIKDFSDEETLHEICKSYIHGFTKINASIIRNAKTAAFAVTSLLLDIKEKNFSVTNASRELINSSNSNYIGIYVSKDNNEKYPTVVIIGVDNFYVGEERSYESYFEEELNSLRANPASYLNHINIIKEEMNKVKTYKLKCLKEVKDLIDLLRRSIPANKISNSELLNLACEDYIYYYQIGKLYAEDNYALESRLRLYCRGVTKARVFVDTNSNRPEETLSKILVNEKQIEKRGPEILLSDEFKYFGAISTNLGNTKLTVVILADNAEDITDRPIEEDIESFINSFRTSPIVLTKYILSYKEIIEAKKRSLTPVQTSFIKKSKNQKERDDGVRELEDKLNFANEVLENIKMLRSAQELERKAGLDNIALQKNKQNPNKTFSEDNTDDIRDFLSKNMSGFYLVDEVSGKLTNDVGIKCFGTFVAKCIIDSCSIDLIKRLLSTNYKIMGINYDIDTDAFCAILIDSAQEFHDSKSQLKPKHKLKRPGLTSDEIDQIREDFAKLDYSNKGVIMPKDILAFVTSTKRVNNINPIYNDVFKTLNTLENNEKGINVDEFISSVQFKVKNLEKSDWEIYYDMALKESKSEQFDLNTFRKLSRRLRFDMKEDEISSTFKVIADQNGIISKVEFLRLMQISY